MKLRSKLLFTLLIVGIFACSEAEKKPPYVIPDNAGQLVAGNSGKTWKLARRFNDGTRMNMGDCFLAYRQTYRPDMTVRDNNGDNYDCGESLEGKWTFAQDEAGNYYIKISSEQLPELMNIEEEYKYFKVLHLADDELVLQFAHRQFSNKKTRITDILVPENSSVEGRDFHW